MTEAELRHNLSNRHWRINNLYRIIDPAGTDVLFQSNEAQDMFLRDMWYLNLILKARQLGFCVSPETRVLTADLEWIKIRDIQPGTEVIACDEHPPGGRGSARKMRTATVEAVRVMRTKRYRITMDDGRAVVCTDRHPWLSRKIATDAKWRSISGEGNAVTGRLTVGTKVRWVAKPWDEPTPEDGWFGGMLDGEGSIAKSNNSAGVSVSQRHGPVWDRLVKYAAERGYNACIENDAPIRPNKYGREPVPKLAFGRIDEMFRLIGQTRPTRFVGNRFWEGRELPGKRNGGVGWATIISIEDIGVGDVVDMQTTTGTYIAEGFVSHNTTLVCILYLDTCLFNSNVSAGIIAHTREDAEEFFTNKVKYAYDRLPAAIRNERPADTDRANKLSFANGSSLRVGTSLRSGTNQLLHISEFGKICARFPDKAREVVTGALNTVHPGQHIIIESTAEGREGYFYDYCMEAQKRDVEGRSPHELEFKLHFYPWWKHPGYHLDPDKVTVTREALEYFKELNAQGITLTARQKAWWIAKHHQMGDDMTREFPSTVEEAFKASVQGAYYQKQMNEIRRTGRITSVPVAGVPVNTGWDLGMNDETTITFHQMVGREHRIVDYYAASGESLGHFAKVLQDKGYIYGRHYLPHDAVVKSLNDGKSRVDILRGHGLRNITVVPRTQDVGAGIDMVRSLLDLSWIDASRCNPLIKCLDEYRKEWNDKLGCYMDRPLHNWASHGADSIRTLASGLKDTTPTIFVSAPPQAAGGYF